MTSAEKVRETSWISLLNDSKQTIERIFEGMPEGGHKEPVHALQADQECFQRKQHFRYEAYRP